MGRRSKMKYYRVWIFFKRWQSFSRVAHSYSNLRSDPQPFHDVQDWDEVTAPDFTEKTRASRLVHADHDYKEEEKAPEGSKAVYVGNNRRRYFISAEYLNHPLLTLLIVDNFRDGFSIALTEVVLFEHLVWILENSDPESIPTKSTLEDLAEFYICN